MEEAPRGSGLGWFGQMSLVVSLLSCAAAAGAQGAPAAVPHVDATSLTGEWYEVASTGTWWHRHCRADTRYLFDQPGPTGWRATSACTTPRGLEVHRGRLRTGRAGDGRLSIRFTPRLFAWLAATWSDFWVLGTGDDGSWMLVGDNRRERLLIVSRTVTLDEAAIARALAAARQQGYVIDRLALVPQTAGATGVVLPR